MKRENIFRSVQLAAISSYILFLSGCWSASSNPPLIPPVINTKLPTYSYGSYLNWTDSNDYDASVLFYIDYSVQYAKQNHWISISDWFIYKLNKIETVEGQFDEDEISFLIFESHAKPGSWIQYTPVPIQYERRMVLLLGLKKQGKYYNIVSQEQRSWLAPYGKLVKPEQADNFKQIINAVCTYLNIDQAKFEKIWQFHLNNYARHSELVSSYQETDRREKELLRLRNNAGLPGVGNFEIVDENDEYYVIRIHFFENSKQENIIVNKTTLEVKQLPVPEKR
jgi:hypothetical protein